MSLDDGQSWQPVASSVVHVAGLGSDLSGNILAVDRVGNAFNSQFGPLRSSFTSAPDKPIAFVEHVGTTWLAGGADGQLLRSVDGQVWNRVQVPLSDAALRACVWRSAFQFENRIWIVGSPGSIVLHSEDQGLNWQVLSTEQTLPLRSVAFADSQRGWAVGPLGLILATRDCGRTWYPQRRTASRLGLMAVTGSDAQVPWPSLIAASWDEQVAAGSISMFADSPEQSADYRVEKWSFNEAVAPQMGLVEHRAWLQSKPLANNAADVASLSARLAVEFQSWRPDVVLTNELVEASSLAANRAAMAAITSAIQQAKANSPQSISAELKLPAWQVTKLAAVTNARNGQYSEHPNRLLREPGLSIWDVLMPMGSSLNVDADAVSIRTIQQEQNTLANKASLFGGIAPNQASRRQVTIRSLGNYQLIMGRVHRITSLDNLITLPPETPITEWQLQLDFVARALPPRELAPSLLRIVNGCSSPNLWARRQVALERLIQLQPDSDAASSARLTLLQMLSSDEMRAWQQSIESETASKVGLGSLANATSLNEATTAQAVSPFDVALKQTPSQAATSTNYSKVVTASFSNSATTELSNEAAERARRAKSDEAFFLALDNCFKADPYLVKLPELELIQQSRQRAKSEALRTAPPVASALESMIQRTSLAGWPQVAQQELLLERGRPENLRWIAFAVATPNRPKLDGVLDEEMWQACPPMQLVSNNQQKSPPARGDKADANEPTNAARIFWSYDDRYLYIGIDAPQSARTTSAAPPKLRKYDSDLTAVDHLHFTLDTDRDYSSAVELGVSELGETFDRCCELASFNPKYSVAVPQSQPSGRWTAEVAIRISDITTQSDLTGRAWAVAAHRRNANGTPESWSSMKTEQAALKAAGLLLFVPSPK